MKSLKGNKWSRCDEDIIGLKIENIPELLIDYTNYKLISIDKIKNPINIVNTRFIIDGLITFKFGMEDAFYIQTKQSYFWFE